MGKIGELNEGGLDAGGMKIGLVTARWNQDITFLLEEGALIELKKLGCTQIEKVRVPGAFEIPLAAQALMDQGCEGVICLGAVIRGDTAHFEYVCSSVERGCTELQLRAKKPVGFGILTVDNHQQAMERVGGKHGHKGTECAQAVVEMVQLLKQIKTDR